MTIWKHEMRQGRLSLIIWAASISLLMGMCVLIFPEMSSDMDDVGAMFSNMGGFSAAFGMDKINFGSFVGFFAIECGNILGLGGAFYAALTGITALAKEEKEHTAEFLLTHPISRIQVVVEKLLAVFTQILILNLVAIGVTAACSVVIEEEIPIRIMALLFTAYFFMQLEIAEICFGISAFLRQGGLGIGLGAAAMFYFMNIIANLTDKLKFIKYITPFGYCDGADIIAEEALSAGYLAVGVVLGVLGIVCGFYRYIKKDIA